MLANEPLSILSLDLSKIKPIGFEREKEKIKYTEVVTKMEYVLKVLQDAQSTKMNHKLPGNIKDEINSHVTAFLRFVDSLESEKGNLPPADFAEQRMELLSRIDSYCNNFFDSMNGRAPNFVNFIGYFKPSPFNKLEVKVASLESSVESFLNSYRDRYDAISEEFSGVKVRMESTLKEIQEKAASTVVSEYATVFSKEADKNLKHSRTWLIAGIVVSSIILATIILFYTSDYFKSSERIEAGGQVYYIYDFSKLFAKAILLSTLFYLAAFTLKKYSTFKHLEATNVHRKNALNSYLLFKESIVGNDDSSHNTLMLQVSKAIYEHVPSGFIDKLDDAGGGGILEVTKIIGNNSGK